jgi:hypothetical protein
MLVTFGEGRNTLTGIPLFSTPFLDDSQPISQTIGNWHIAEIPVNGMVRRRNSRSVKNAGPGGVKSRVRERVSCPVCERKITDGTRVDPTLWEPDIGKGRFKDRPVYKGEGERISIMARSQ